MDDDWGDDFLEDDEESEGKEIQPWLMLVVDDEVGIHDVTKIALKRFSFEGRPLEFLSAYSAEEALSILKKREDVALILLDVVMETDHAGLECARQIREELGIFSTRIVLRTGQPGVAPEEDVILAYDINDYRAKTELTSARLFTTVVSALRSYRDILALNKYREDAYHLLGQNVASQQAWINMVDHPMFQIGSDFLIHKCNTCFAELLNFNTDQLIGSPLPPNEFEGLIEACRQKKTQFLLENYANKNWTFQISYSDFDISILMQSGD